VYTGHANLFSNRYSAEEQQIMGSDPSEELVDTTADNADDDKEPEVVEEVLEAGDDGDDDGEDEKVVVEDIDEAGDSSYFYTSPNKRGRRVTVSGATGSDNSKDGNWVSFHDKEQWRHAERQKEHRDELIVADLVRWHFKTTNFDNTEYYECELCNQLFLWPRERGAHILQVHGSRNSPSNERRSGNLIAQYKKQLKADLNTGKRPFGCGTTSNCRAKIFKTVEELEDNPSLRIRQVSGPKYGKEFSRDASKDNTDCGRAQTKIPRSKVSQ
jgi:hypothetical protein